jgi:phosphate:Na+ symporter
VLLLLFLFPFGNRILKIAVKVAGRDKDEESEDYGLEELDESILETPEYAIENSLKSIYKLMNLVRRNLQDASTGFIDKKYDTLEAFWKHADQADRVNDTISGFLTKVYSEKLSKEENAEVASCLHVLISLQRVNNHSKGLAKLTSDVKRGNLKYSDVAIEELKEIADKVIQSAESMIQAFRTGEIDYINEVTRYAETVNAMRQDYKARHFNRTISGGYCVQSGLVYAEAARQLSRIAGNMESVVQALTTREDSYW